jgi:tRNA-splicing ligase RtcB
MKIERRCIMRVLNTERIPIKMWFESVEDLEPGALEQAKNAANLPFAYKWVALMPDAHQGYGIPIGGVVASEEVVSPNLVGVDIGCGMVAVKTSLTDIDQGQKEQWARDVRGLIPIGLGQQNDDNQSWEGFDRAPDLEVIQIELDKARKQLGSLGAGNHFIELQYGSDGYIWIMIHSGSRNFGYRTAKHYHEVAKILCERWKSDLPDKDLAFLPVDEKIGREYLEAMSYAMDFAWANRDLMMERAKYALSIAAGLGADGFKEVANIHHNYAKLENHFGKNVFVHRKGATKATKDTIGIIPGSMGTKSYITRGLGNPESFQSSSHGAGRRMGRGQARRELDLEKERAKMAGILGGPRDVKDLDEAPGAYKDIDTVMKDQEDLVEVLVELRPLVSIKG